MYIHELNTHHPSDYSGSAGHRTRRNRAALTVAGLLTFVLTLLSACSLEAPEAPRTFNAELEYFKTLNEAGPARNPQIIFLLMVQYLNTNQTGAGIANFESLLERHGPRMAPPQRGLPKRTQSSARLPRRAGGPIGANRLGGANRGHAGGGKAADWRESVCGAMDFRRGGGASAAPLQELPHGTE